MMFATNSAFNYTTPNLNLILHKSQRYTIIVKKIVLSIPYIIIAPKSYSHTRCSLSAQICVMSVRTSLTQRNRQSIGYLEIRTDQIPSYLNGVIFGHFHRRNVRKKNIKQLIIQLKIHINTSILGGFTRDDFIRCLTSNFIFPFIPALPTYTKV